MATTATWTMANGESEIDFHSVEIKIKNPNLRGDLFFNHPIV